MHLLKILLLIGGISTNFAFPQRVYTLQPKVINPATGVTFHGNLSSGIESFFNIRFGEDTSGGNRFALPKPFHYHDKAVVDASNVGAACPQVKTAGIFPSHVKDESEDCLTLRIDRIQNTKANAKLPVMVYLYGGGFTSGFIYDPMYDPTGLLKAAEANGSPIVYAAVNYRLGLFGFASTPALKASGSLNVGLYDQRLGLEWIKAHIRMFGGDPDNITIFGESAGAFSVGHQINAFGGAKPVPFHRAIFQSGMSTSVPGTTGDICTNRTKIVAQRVNCTSTDPLLELECLRGVPLDVLLPIVTEFELSIASNALLAFQPIAPSPFIPDAPSKLLRAGRFAKGIDIINGWIEDDGTVFVKPNISTDAEALEAVTFPVNLKTSTARQLLSLYPLSNYHPAQSGNRTASAQFFRASDMYRDAQFICPSLLLEQVMTQYSQQPRPSNYLYDLNATLYTPIFERLNLSFLGVIHASDLQFVFSTASALATATDEQKALATSISASWASFASTGNPSRGKVSLKEWSEGYRPRQDIFKTRIVGGPNDGMTTIGNAAQELLASEHIIEKCAFWNSQEVLDQLQT